jgi:hypothetical protein
MGIRCFRPDARWFFEPDGKKEKHHFRGAFLKCIDNNDTVSNSFIWFHSKNETIKREVKLSF